MKIKLNQEMVMRLTLEQKPVREKDGKIVEYVPNSAPYLLTDIHRDAPVGFCVKVGKTKKTYLVQRRHGSKVFQVKIGEVADYTLDEARKKAGDKAKEIEETGCSRRLNIDPPCRLNIDPGPVAVF